MALLVGRTPVFKVIELCGRYNATVYVKREDLNPFGTFKDRRAAALIDMHKDKRDVVFVQITFGNSGYSLGMMAREKQGEGQRIQVVNIVPPWLSPTIKDSLATCSVVHEMDMGRFISMDEMRRIARQRTGFDGPEQHILGVEEYNIANGYTNIIKEIHEEGIRPTRIFCPVGSGELLVALIQEAERIWGSEAPLIVGATIRGNSLLGDRDFIIKPHESKADKLVNGYSPFKEIIRRLRAAGKAELKTVAEKAIAREHEYLASIGIPAEPSAAVAFCGAGGAQLSPQDVVVIIDTGKGVYDADSKERQAACHSLTPEQMKNYGERIISIGQMLNEYGRSKGDRMVARQVVVSSPYELRSIVEHAEACVTLQDVTSGQDGELEQRRGMRAKLLEAIEEGDPGALERVLLKQRASRELAKGLLDKAKGETREVLLAWMDVKSKLVTAAGYGEADKVAEILDRGDCEPEEITSALKAARQTLRRLSIEEQGGYGARDASAAYSAVVSALQRAKREWPKWNGEPRQKRVDRLLLDAVDRMDVDTLGKLLKLAPGTKAVVDAWGKVGIRYDSACDDLRCHSRTPAKDVEREKLLAISKMLEGNLEKHSLIRAVMNGSQSEVREELAKGPSKEEVRLALKIANFRIQEHEKRMRDSMAGEDGGLGAASRYEFTMNRIRQEGMMERAGWLRGRLS